MGGFERLLAVGKWLLDEQKMRLGFNIGMRVKISRLSFSVSLSCIRHAKCQVKEWCTRQGLRGVDIRMRYTWEGRAHMGRAVGWLLFDMHIVRCGS
jgi:hypothetical protein